MKNIVLARIDDRLIHGQVITAWVKFVDANLIIIVDDDLSKNKLMQRIYVAASPTGIELRILTLEAATELLREDNPSVKVLILVKSPLIFEQLYHEGIVVPEIILGGMGSNIQRSKLIRNAYASQEERDCMNRLIQKGVEIFFQIVPDEKRTNLRTLL